MQFSILLLCDNKWLGIIKGDQGDVLKESEEKGTEEREQKCCLETVNFKSLLVPLSIPSIETAVQLSSHHNICILFCLISRHFFWLLSLYNPKLRLLHCTFMSLLWIYKLKWFNGSDLTTGKWNPAEKYFFLCSKSVHFYSNLHQKWSQRCSRSIVTAPDA